MKVKFKQLGLIVGLAVSLSSPFCFAEPKGNSRNKVTWEILENLSSDACPFSYNVVLDVRYKFHPHDDGIIELSLSEDGVAFYPVLTEQTEGDRGQTVLAFDAGECAQAINIELR